MHLPISPYVSPYISLGETLYVGHEDTWELVSLNVQVISHHQ